MKKDLLIPPEELQSLFDPAIPFSQYVPVTLAASGVYDLETNEGLEQCVRDQILEQDGKFGFGGYLERRDIYRRSDHFGGESERNIHLGIDFWGPKDMDVFSPLKGEVHSLQYNDAPFDYGATLIIRHDWEGHRFHLLYGHIRRQDLEKWSPGDRVDPGENLCGIGGESENGGWVPHLHFQCILDMEGKKGDYPGVCALEDRARYSKNCPNPLNFWHVSRK